VLWVAEDHRGRGLASHMLRWAEAQGRALGARHTKLETFEWQARAFYLRQGYAKYARIDDDYVPGFYLAYMKKTLG
jgi:GNAT superfamily N-acetyltransferase